MKTIIGPILSLIFYFLDATFGIQFSNDIQGQVLEWVLKGAAGAWILYGFIKTHNLKKNKKDTL